MNTLPRNTTELIFEAITYSLAMASYISTGVEPSEDDINEVAQTFFCSFMDTKSIKEVEIEN